MLTVGREPQRAVSNEDHHAHEHGDPRRAEIELAPRVPLGLSEQPRRLTGIEPTAVAGSRALINVVCSLHAAPSGCFVMQS